MASKATTTRKTTKPGNAAKVAPAAKKSPVKKIAVKGPAAADTAKAATKSKPAGEKKRGKKDKTIRDSFNMPAADYALIAALKTRAGASGRAIKKSELLRAGLKSLSSMDDTAFRKAIDLVEKVKAGRPEKKVK